MTANSLTGAKTGFRKRSPGSKPNVKRRPRSRTADLDERQRFERDYLISQIDKDLFWRETADQPHTNPYWYSDPTDPDVYVSRPYAPLETRIKSFTTYAKNLPAALEQIKGNLQGSRWRRT